jgi:hypothetical protein
VQTTVLSADPFILRQNGFELAGVLKDGMFSIFAVPIVMCNLKVMVVSPV